jgi:chemotaxis signal transduction protein
MTEPTTTNPHQFCTFYLDHLLFGIESQKIQEVVTYRELRPVPLAPPVVSGLMNLRGQVVVPWNCAASLNCPSGLRAWCRSAWWCIPREARSA